MKDLESVIIGGGQAGLATSYFLKKEGHEHLVFEKDSKPASAWRNGRWDSFTLVTPNWTLKMPGMDELSDREGYLPRNQIVNYFENYVKKFDLPVQFNTEVITIEQNHSGYVIHTADNVYKVKNVVIATGFFQKHKVPKFSSEISADIIQISSDKYRNPDQLSDGAVLVVGSGQSGCQIAEELCLSGKKVYLGTGCTSGRVPRRYRGKDIVEWLNLAGFFNRTPEMLPPGSGKYDGTPHVTGSGGGHTLNVHQFKKDGIRLLGHLRGAEGNMLFIAPDLYKNLNAIDQFEMNARKNIDTLISKSGMNAPEEEIILMKDGYYEPVIEVLDLRKENIKTIIWSCGYSFDYSFIKMPVHEKDGFPSRDSSEKYKGLHFAGIPWMPALKTGLLIGVEENAKKTAEKIIRQEKDMVN